MLLICEPKNFEKLQGTFKKWSLDAAILGEVQKERKIKLLWGGEVLTEIDPDLIVEHAPQYKRPYSPWHYPNRAERLPKTAANYPEIVKKLMAEMKLNSQYWIYNQYDQRVGARTAADCSSSVAFARLDHSGRGLALAVGCRPEVMLMDAEIGAFDSIYYPSFQMALKGATAMAATDCLNFGNPQKPEIMSEFVASVEAIAKASVGLDAPVISGNVSFYNETLGENIISTPAVGVVGLRDSVEEIIPDQFTQANEHIFMVKLPWVESNVYAYTANRKKTEFTLNSDINVADFIKICTKLDKSIRINSLKVSSVKAVGLGGIGITCLKMCTDQIGFDLSYDMALEEPGAAFKDHFYAFLISTSESPDGFKNFLKQHFAKCPVEIKKIGETRLNQITFSGDFSLGLSEFRDAYKTGLEITNI
jgi:phosphoribosylformylglycinamidine synthase